ncbi:hypothetical protein FSP39_025350 [Pinctada imbricata]|uniref:BHLH domain-containing protein n=1 Tax=Pinctada imbricata TaxID=66713 RepID=A0AA88YD17_PINIB|nr:hypothetical protein FSP39_025350 [Pinctada imbricata]
MQDFDSSIAEDFFPVKISSPTCEDLGIPRDSDDICVPIVSARVIQNPSLHLDGIRYEAAVKGTLPKRDPFSPLCMIPLPSPFTLDHLEPTFVRKRNERERERVRCVNDGYSRLKEHLPLENKNKRISKVDTLRRAIEYIRYLRSLLAENDDDKMSEQVKTTDIADFDFGECGEFSSNTVSAESQGEDTEYKKLTCILGDCRDNTEKDYNLNDTTVKCEHGMNDDFSTCCRKRKIEESGNVPSSLKRQFAQNA